MSPPETDAERAERERGEHAIEVYEKATAELDRLLQAGKSEPSAELEKYVSGPFLTAVTQLLAQVSAAGERLEGEVKQVDIWVHGVATEESASLVSCEDGTDSYFVDENGQRLEGNPDAAVQVQRIKVEPDSGNTWKVTQVETENHASFEGTVCADAG